MIAMVVLPAPFETRTTVARLVFDPVDRFAQRRQVAGATPRPVGPVRYRLVETGSGGNVERPDPQPRLLVAHTASGYDCWFGSLQDRDEPPRTPRALPPPFVVRVEADAYQPLDLAIAAVPHPDPAGARTPVAVPLEPGYAYPFPTETAAPDVAGPTLLRGTLRAPDGAGIGQALVEMDPPPPGQPFAPRYWTDRTGHWVLPFAEDVQSAPDLTVRVTLPGAGPVDVPEVRVTRGDTSALRQAALSGRAVEAGGRGLPGVAVSVAGEPGSTLSDADGTWTLWLPVEEFPPSGGQPAVTVTATAPSGAAQSRVVTVQPRATTPVPHFAFG